MNNKSQENLISLAQEALTNNNLSQAKQYFLEALRLGHNSVVVVKLCEILLTENKADQAYTLIKEEPDLFSDNKIFEMYLEILKKLNFNIEYLELEHLLNKQLGFQIKAAPVTEQVATMAKFKQLKTITESDYLKLFTLSQDNFVGLAKSLLLDPMQNFALRLSLCEDLIKLGIKEKVEVFILGKKESFVPEKTLLLEKNPIYREVCVSIADYLRRDPSKLTLMVGELNIVMGMLYPKINTYIQDPDQFAHDFRIYLDTKEGGANQELLDKIYEYLAYEKAKNDKF